MSRLHITVVTLFPKEFLAMCEFGVLGQALRDQKFSLSVVNPRDFTNDAHHTVDDRPFGGGDGMVMLTAPLRAALSHAQLGVAPEATLSSSTHRVYLSPQGQPLVDATVKRLSGLTRLVLVCGRYGGVDQRFLNECIDEEISLGDFVISGGEPAAFALVDAISRKIPGVLGHQDSAEMDSFARGWLEGPSYTRPQEVDGQKVPEILLSGDHQKIAKWRDRVAKLTTLQRRPDLVAKIGLTDQERQDLEKFRQGMSQEELRLLGLSGSSTLPLASRETKKSTVPRVALALVHHPILDRSGEVVATNITNFDIHDIARASTVYGLDAYYLVHPHEEQRMFVARILDHWRVGKGAKFNPYRKASLEVVQSATSVEAAVRDWQTRLGQAERPLVLGTHARSVQGVASLSLAQARGLIEQGRPTLVVFGTGYGMTDELMGQMDGVLESIRGAPPRDFRHLSVRSAVSIYLDRLLGPW